MRNCEAGDIIHLDFGNDSPVFNRKTKYAVVVSNVRSLFFCVNTENRPEYNCLSVERSKYYFLKNREHFIACNHVFEFRNNHKVQKKGYLDNEDLKRLKEHLSKNTILTRLQKEEIIKSISDKITK